LSRRSCGSRAFRHTAIVAHRKLGVLLRVRTRVIDRCYMRRVLVEIRPPDSKLLPMRIEWCGLPHYWPRQAKGIQKIGGIPHDKICVTSNATLGLHAAFDFAGNGRTVTNLEATQMLYSGYPSQVRRWISRRGGLTPRMIFLGGKQLQAMYRPCYFDVGVPR
jgi:hypothetical protein